MTQTLHPWQFSHSAGFDQVRLETWLDLAHLNELDQKLWVALSVPARGLAIDEKTLALIDADGDGHIRPPELMQAIQWAGARLKNRQALVAGLDPLPLDMIDADRHPELLAALQHILQGLDKSEATHIAVEDTCEAVSRFAAQALNGDGIVTSESTEQTRLAELIHDLSLAYEGPIDRNGSAGVDEEVLTRFRTDLHALETWYAGKPGSTGSIDALTTLTNLSHSTPLPSGQNPLLDAGEALLAVQDKIEDYFTRCHLVLFDPLAEAPVNSSEEQLRHLGSLNLALPPEDMAALPLARVTPECSLPLTQGINPAWRKAMQAFVLHCVTPLLGEQKQLTEANWEHLKTTLNHYTRWYAERPDNPVRNWPQARLADIVSTHLLTELEQLLAADLALKPEAEAITSADRMTRYLRDLPRLIRNFVNFEDFYENRIPAAFQAGTLYIDGRSCTLTLEVLDPAKHAALAALSGTYLLYCECRRNEASKQIVAAVTAGDVDQLLVGRNGIYYDRAGQDWDATITRIVDHPISLRQAFWSPYKRLSKLITSQIQKFAAQKESSSDALLAKTATPPAADPPKTGGYDIARFAGIFAAIGLALGALGTALASLVTGFLSLSFWQIPLAVAGIILLISGPSVGMAWFKLRNRSLAVLLDANGWAVNARARISIPFGTRLTQLARLPGKPELRVPFSHDALSTTEESKVRQ